MNVAELTSRALRVQKLYAGLATKRGDAPWSRIEIAQGFVGDVGDLMKLVMAKEGRRISRTKNLEAALAHELADCLWSILVLADAYEVNLQTAFGKTMSELEKKLTPRRRTRTARTSRVPRG